MLIPESCFIYINILIGIIYLISCVIAIKNGLIFQLITLLYTFICIYVSWLLSPILASKFPLLNIDNKFNVANLEVIINSFIYCLIIFVLLKILYWFISPLFKSVSKIPILGSLNKIGGFVFGLINGTIIVLLLSLLLNTPMIANSSDVKENTILKYSDKLTNSAIELTVKYINFDYLKDKFDNFNVEETRETLKTWLNQQGILDE